MTNEEIIAKIEKFEAIFKATTEVSDGLLNAEQAKQFIRTTIDEQAFLKRIGVVQMLRDKKDISLIGLENRIMRKGEKDTDPDVAIASKGVRKLDVVEFVTAFNIYFDDLEQMIEEGNYEQTLTDLFTTQIGNDIADLSLNGDESLTEDDFCVINNGFFKIASSDTGVHIDIFNDEKMSEIFSSMLSKMPNKWKANKKELAYFVSCANEQKYRDEIGARPTLAGDKALLDDMNVTFQGIEIIPVAQMVDTKVLLTKPQNLKIGWHGRYIRLGKWINERKRRIEYTISGKTDFEYAVSDMMVVFTKSA
jgi:hypothetical protein